MPDVAGDNFNGNLLDCLEPLPEIRGQAYHADELQRIAAEARTRGKETTLQRLAIYLRGVISGAASKEN
ncbi:reverse transcriptase [Lasius niger]|uniref:Reverse transcriptase n=1 Tax=Lasius niger TaxID=67767 RepID=A0A0J7KIC3_LASNI|nr:reverse transcriptase [Lasius niger]